MVSFQKFQGYFLTEILRMTDKTNIMTSPQSHLHSYSGIGPEWATPVCYNPTGTNLTERSKIYLYFYARFMEENRKSNKNTNKKKEQEQLFFSSPLENQKAIANQEPSRDVDSDGGKRNISVRWEARHMSTRSSD